MRDVDVRIPGAQASEGAQTPGCRRALRHFASGVPADWVGYSRIR